MPPIPQPTTCTPRLILYHQTHHDPSGKLISALPLQNTGLTHLYIAAFHLNPGPDILTLNDHVPSHPRNDPLWLEVKQLQAQGITVLGMLGGAAKGSYALLAQDFERYYVPLRDAIRQYGLQGLDLDIEEDVSLPLVTTLLTRLKTDLGQDFLCTLAPVLPAMLPYKPWLRSFCYRLLHPELGEHPSALVRAFIKAHLLKSHEHLSGFNHFALEASPAGKLVAWYNVQLYCGWGDAANHLLFEAMVQSGWDPKKIAWGVVSHPGNGSGYVELERLGRCVATLREKYGDGFGGVMGWEMFNAGGSEGLEPREWAQKVAGMLRLEGTSSVAETAANSAETGAPGPSNVAVRGPNDIQDLQKAMQEATVQPSASTATGTAQATSPLAGSQLPSSNADGDVRRLVDMGFERSEAVAALEAMGGDVDAAADLLFGD